MAENAIKILGVTDNDVARLTKSLERVKAGREFFERMTAEGIDCEGRENDCAQAIIIAEATLKAIADNLGA